MAVCSVIKAWAVLVALSLCTALLSAAQAAQREHRIFIAAGLLTLAGFKARLILADYLGLKSSRFWSRLFGLTLGLFLVAAFAFYGFAERT